MTIHKTFACPNAHLGAGDLEVGMRFIAPHQVSERRGTYSRATWVIDGFPGNAGVAMRSGKISELTTFGALLADWTHLTPTPTGEKQ